jgi:uncharacterized membrane protein
MKFIRIALSVLGLLLVYAGALLVLLSLPYLAFKPNVDFLITKQLIYHIDWWRISFYVHVFCSPFVYFVGLMQFNRSLLKKSPIWHRRMGKTYILLTLLLAAPSGFLLGLYANGGYPSQISFVVLSILWFGLTLQAYRMAKAGDFRRHFNFAILSFALALSAVSLRFYAYLFDVFHINLSPKESYILLSYLSWIPNLLVAFLLTRSKKFQDYYFNSSLKFLK